MMTDDRENEQPKGEDASQPVTYPDRDAIWTVTPGEYVDTEPPVDESLFKTPAELNRALDAAADSLDADDRLSDKDLDELLKDVGDFAGAAHAVSAADPKEDLSLKPSPTRKKVSRGLNRLRPIPRRTPATANPSD